MSPIRLGAAFSFLVLASCSAVRPEVAPPQFLRPVGLTVVVEPKVGELDSPPSNVTDAEQRVDLELALHRVDPRVLDTLQSYRGVRVFSAAACPQEDVERWLGELQASGMLQSPKNGDRLLLPASGQPGVVQNVERVAYVRGFELQQEADASVADPQIAVVDEGVRLRASGARAADGSSTRVELELRLAVLDRPLGQRRVKLASHSSAPVVVQAPTGLTWTLRAEEPLAPGEALVLTGCTNEARSLAFIAVLRSRASTGKSAAIARAPR